MIKQKTQKAFSPAKLFAAVALACVFNQAYAEVPAENALPTGGQVTAGQAHISQQGSTMNIDQSSQRAVVNWSSFDVGSKATVNFNQPNAQAATLNYVSGATKSMINGAVNANGQVIFVNNNGVVFGKNAEVNVGGMVATTMNVDQRKFMEGDEKLTFTGDGTGKVVNKGHLNVTDLKGYIALMAPEVKNEGVITATLSGENAIALVSGQKVSLTFSGNQLVSVSVDASSVNSLIKNKHLIQTNGGHVIIAANAANDLLGSVIKNTGVISATGISKKGGVISLTGDTVKQAGNVVANSDTNEGGKVTISGNNITLASGSNTTATGATQGGTVLVGTTVAKPVLASNSSNTATTPMAKNVTVEAGANVDASATQKGNGGTIAIWSQIKTAIAGNLSAKAGAQKGNGGFIETSSLGQVSVALTAKIDTSAAHGKAGNWTIDPTELVIDSTAATAISNALANSNVTLDATLGGCAGFGVCTSSVTPKISFNADAHIASSNVQTVLNLIATGGEINFNSVIEAGSINAVADNININAQATLTALGGSNGNILLVGANINILGVINANGSTGNSGSTSNTSAGAASASTRRRTAVDSGLAADLNTYLSNGGNIKLLATGDVSIDTNASITANGLNGGSVTIISQNGTVNHQGVVDAVGTQNTGGQVTIAGHTATVLNGALISVDGLNTAGTIQLGSATHIDATPAGANSVMTTPVNQYFAQQFTVTSLAINLDINTGISASAFVSNQNTLNQNASNQNTSGGQIDIAGTTLNIAATILANADSGGQVTMIATDTVQLQNAHVQTNGSNGRGGSIAISGAQQTLLNSATISATGLEQGGKILIGNDVQHGTLPFSVYTSLDALTVINAGQINPNSLAGGFVETSGQTLGLLAAINAGRGGMWLLDPFDITIGATEAGYINTALNAGTNVSISTANSSNTVGSNSISGTSGTGIIFIQAAINATTGNASLTLTASEVQLQADVTTKGDQTYNADLLLAKNVTLTSNNGNVTVNGDVKSTTYSIAGYISLNGAGAYYFNLTGVTGTATASGVMVGGGLLSYNSTTATYTWVSGVDFAAQYLLVGAGGAGGYDNGGGGGAGGVAVGSNYAVTAGTSYTITVGIAGVNGTNGGSSTITSGGVTLTATGGLKGGSGGNFSGGAGGLSGYTIINGVTTTANSGGPFTPSNPYCMSGCQKPGGGGGGAGASSTNSSGGAGVVSSITGTAVTYGVGGGGAINEQQGVTAVGAGGGGGGGSGGYGYGPTGRNGTVIFQGRGFTPDVYTLTVNSGTGNFAVTGNVTNVVGITVNSASNSNYIDGVISGIAFVTKQGTGILTLNGINTYSGNTTISAGTLKAGSNQAFGVVTSSMTVASGATLDLNGTNQIVLNPLTASGTGVGTNGAIINSDTTNAATYRGPITLGAMTYIGGPGDLTLSGAITTTTGIVFVNSSYVTATNSANSINSIAGVAPRGLTLTNNRALSVTTVNSKVGIANATGQITITNLSGGLTVSQAISSSGDVSLNSTSTLAVAAITATANISGDRITLVGNSATGYAVNVSSAISAINGITVTGNGTTAANIVALGVLTQGAYYVPGTNTSATVISSSAGTAGSVMGKLASGAALPIISGGVLAGSSIGAGGGGIAITSASLLSSTATTATYIVGFYDGTTYTKMVQVVLTASGGFVYATETAAKYSNTALGSGTATNVLNNTSSNLIQLWNGSTAGGVGTVTAQTLATTTAAVGYAAANLTLAGTGFDRTISGNITVTANNTAAGSSAGITQTGAITMNSNGGNISFTSNNSISQSGAIAMVANTSGTASSVTYNTTTGNKTSTITTGALTVAAGSTSAINYSVLAAGATITSGAVSVPGAITLDNTYGCTGTGCTPASGYINLTNFSTLANTTGHGVTSAGSLSAGTGVVVKGVTYSANHGVNYTGSAISTMTGGISLNGTTNTGSGMYINNTATTVTATNGDITFNGYELVGNAALNLNSGAIAATNGAITMVGSATTGSFALWSATSAAMTAKTGITITGAQTASTANTIVALNATPLNVTGVGANINVTANLTAGGGANGIVSSGAISGASGSNITFTSNNIINQTGAISLAANTSGTASGITYDTTSGTKASTIAAGALTITTGSTSAINYVMKSAGSAIDPAAIGTTTVRLPGYVLLDNTFGGSTPATGYYNVSNIATVIPTVSVGVTINNAIYATDDVTVKGIASANQGVAHSAVIDSSAGDISITGITSNNRGVYGTAGLTGNNITILGQASAASSWIVQLSALTINPTAVGGSISVTGTGATAGANNGIYQTGAISGASGTNITFTSNNNISTSGAVTLAANTSGTASLIKYDTSTGDKTSAITTGTLSVTAGSTSAINYLIKAAGANINPNVVSVPGYITLDNTYLNGVSGGINSSNLATYATTSYGIQLNNILTAGTTLTVKGVSNGNNAVLTQAAMYATAGDIEMVGTGTANWVLSNGVNGVQWYAAPLTANNGAIRLTATATSGSAAMYAGALTAKSITVNGTTNSGTYASYLGAMTIVAGGGDILVYGTNLTNGAAANSGIYQAGAITVNASGSNISFISNGVINQSGAIALVANTSANASTILYDTTSGTKASNITAGALTLAAGSTNLVSYVMKSAGSALNPNALNVTGSVTLDNTYGCTGTGCTPATGYVTAANLATLATASPGVKMDNAVTADRGITIKGISNGGYGISFTAAITSTTQAINLTGTSTTSSGVYASTAGSIVALSDQVTIVGVSTTGKAVDLSSPLTGNAISITANGTTATTIASLVAMTVNTVYVAGSNAAPTFISLSTSATNGTYIGTISGTALPNLTAASLAGTSVGTGAAAIQSASVIYLMSGSTSTNANYLIGWGSGTATKLAQLNLQLIGTQVIATTMAAKTSTTALTTGSGTNILTLWNAGTAATAQATSLTTAGIGISNIAFNGTTFTNNSSGNLSVVANNSAAGSAAGISQTGVINVNANGANISFVSNNKISQAGQINLAANTSGTTSNVVYDTTSGNKTSDIVAGILVNTGSTSPVNYLMKASGAAIDPAVTVSGSVVLDNTYGCTGTGCTPVSGYITLANAATLATASAGVTTTGDITAGTFVTLKGISSGNVGVVTGGVVTALAGDVTIDGYSTAAAQRAVSMPSGSGVYAPAGNILVRGTKSVASTVTVMYFQGASTTAPFVLSASGNIDVIGYAPSSSTSVIYSTNAVFVAGGNITFSGSTGGTTEATVSLTTSAVKATGTFTIQGSTLVNNVATAAPGTAVSAVGTAINLTTASLTVPVGKFNAGTYTGMVADSNIWMAGTTSATGAYDGIASSTQITSTNGSVTLIGISAGNGGVGVRLTSPAGIKAGTDINVSGTARNAATGYGVYISGGGATTSPVVFDAVDNININAYVSGTSATNAYIFYVTNYTLFKSGSDFTISASSPNITSAFTWAIQLNNTAMRVGGNFTLQGATVSTLTNANGSSTGATIANVATASAGSAANVGANYGAYFVHAATLTYASASYANISVTGNVSIKTQTSGASVQSFYNNTPMTVGGTLTIDATATGNSATAVYLNSGALSSTDLMSITGRTSTGTSIVGVYSAAAATLTSAGGISVAGLGAVGGTTGNINMLGAITNTGGAGTGITISSTYNTALANVTNSGADGIRITGGANIAAGTIAGGTITALGTITNTGGIVAISMAQPVSPYTVEGKVGVTLANASMANVRYSVQGGNFTSPSVYVSGNYINYRANVSYTASATVANYSNPYGTAYNETTALNWLRTGSNVTLTIPILPFGITLASVKAGLVWNSTIGTAAVNANVVQNATVLNAGSIKTADGVNVTISSGTPTYTITKANLTITNVVSTTTYDGVTSYASLVQAAGFSVTGLVTSIGGVATGDAVNTVTQTIKSGAVVGSGTAVSGVAQAGSFNAVPSAAVGVGLANYNITYVGKASTVAKAPLQLTAAADSKVYGDTTTALGLVYDPNVGYAESTDGRGYTITSGRLLGTDAITKVYITSTGYEATAGVANSYTATVYGSPWVEGTGLSNYNVTTISTNFAVTPRPLTITASSQSTSYGTVLNLGTSAVTASGLVNGDTITSVTLKYNNASSVPGTVNAGAYTGAIAASAVIGTSVAVGPNNLSNGDWTTTSTEGFNQTFTRDNYTITYIPGNLTVTPKALSLSLNAQTKVYDATAFATLNNASFNLTGFVNGESATINQTLGTYNSVNVANATTVSTALTASNYVAASGTLLSNYILPTSASGAGTITKATLTITANSEAKFVGQGDPSFTYTYSGLQGADTLATAAGTVTVAADRTTAVTILSANGSSITGVMPAAGSEVAGKTYVGALVPSASALNGNYLLNAVGGDYSIAGAGQLIVKVGDTTVSYGTYSNSTNLATAISSSVHALYCTIGSSCGVNDIQTLTNTSVTSAGTNTATFVAHDALSPQGTIQFGVALDTSVLAASYSTGGYLNVGAYTMKPSSAVPTSAQVNYLQNDPNYPILYTSGKVTVTPLTLTVANNTTPTKQYDTTNSMTGVVLTATNALAGDGLSLSGFGTYNSASAGNSVGYTIANIQALGADAANYVLASSTISGTNGVITKAPVTISGLAANDKVYNANATATLNGTPTVFGALEAVTISSGTATATFNNMNVADNIAVTANLSGLVLSNPNYEITGVTSPLVADITPARITVTAAKVYDGSLTVANSGLTVVGVAGQTLSFGAATTATLTNPNVNSAGFDSLNNVSLLDGTGLASNYTLVNPILSTVTITPANLTISATDAVKTYNQLSSVVGATTMPTPLLVSGVLYTNAATGFADTLSGGVYAFANANAGVGNKTLQVSGVNVLNGAVGANANYNITYQDNTTSTINPLAVTISGLTAADKVYDGTNTAVISGTPTINGLLGGDTASVNGTITSGTFSSANAANDIGVSLTLSALTLTNSNYVIVGTTSPLLADITPKPITFTGSASKVYDGTASLSGVSVSTGVGSETLLLSNATANSPNVGSGNFISSGTLVDGTGLASNYILPTTLDATTAPFTITPAPLVVTADNQSMTYGDSSLPTLTATIAGFVNGENASVITGAASLSTTATAYNGTAGSASTAGSYAITASQGTLAATNYSFSYVAGTLTVNRANLTITASDDSKVYGSTTTVAGVTYVNGVATGATTGFTHSGLVNGDTLSTVTLTSLGGSATANVIDGPFTTTPSTAAGSTRTTTSNYNITYAPATTGLSVTPLTLTLNSSTVTRTYDGTDALANMTLSTGVGSETIVLTNVSANSANVGSGNYIDAATITSGTGAASNYALPTLNATTAPVSFTPKAISIAGVKTYDATTGFSGVQVTITGLIGSETLNFSGAASNDANVSTANKYFNAFTLADGTNGGLATNYALPSLTAASASNTVTINPLTLTLNSSTVTRTYDGTTALPNMTLTTSLGQTVTLSNVTSNSDDVGTGNYISSATVSDPNYALPTLNATTAPVSFTPKAISIAGVKTYDATTGFSGVQVTMSGLVGSETLNFSGAASNDANVATANKYFSAITLADGTNGGLAVNYALPSLTAASADNTVTINPLTLTLNSSTVSRPYDGTTALADMTITTSLGETVTLTNVTADSANVGSGNYIDAATITSGTGAASNYALPTLNATTAPVSFTPKAISIAGVKTYDATTGFSGVQVTMSGLIGTETLTYTGAAANDANVATANKYFSAITLADGTNGGLATNYALPSLNAASAENTVTLTPKAISIAGVKTYDATTGFSGVQVTMTGLVGSETLNFSGAASNDANVATVNKYFSAFTLADGTNGGLATNYALPSLTAASASNTVTINPLTLTLNSSTVTRAYDGTDALANMTLTTSLGETVVLTNVSANSANVGPGNYIDAATITSGTGSASNYALPTLNATTAPVAFTPKAISIAGVKTYDATTGFSGVQVTMSGLIGTETLTYTGAAANDANVATANKYFNAFTLADGTNGGLATNYALPSLTAASASNTVTINPLTLTLNGSTVTRAYDGTTALSDMTLTTSLGQTVTLSNVIADSANVGSGNYISAATLNDPNYALPVLNASTAPVSLTPMSITLTAPIITKVYDGGYTYTLSASDLAQMNTQLVGADTVSAATAIFVGSDPNAGINKAITLSSVTINDGNGGQNYSVTYANSTGVISPKPLTITAANDAKFVTQADNPAYAGALYNGFVNGENAGNLVGSLVLTRSDATNNNAGDYTLTPSGFGAVSGNYQVTYAPGTYTIVPAGNLLVRATATTTYGTAPTYQYTAQYLDANNNVLSYIGDLSSSPHTSANAINLTATGVATSFNTAVTLNDGISNINMAYGPIGTTLSGSGNINAGQYNLDKSTFTPTGNFLGLTVVGQLTVNPKQITAPTLTANSISKVYDGNAVISGIDTSSASNQLIAGDAAAILASGIYSDKNVASGKSVTVNFGLDGDDAANYVLSATQVTGNYGQITQLASVTYVGPSGGNWSTASNWAGGAIPDYANVANVIIPVNTIVNFDNSVGGPMTSAIQNNGLLNINLNANTTLANTITGTGVLEISNVGTITLTGNNSYTGGTILNAGASLVAGSNSAIGTGGITSNGTANNPASFATGNGVVLPSLSIAGGTTKLMSSITTIGAQSYADLVLGANGTTTLATTNADISLLGKVDSAINKTNSLVIDAGTGNVTIGDSIGSVARFNHLTATGRVIYILADVLTGMTQTYNGSVLIGDASFLGRTPVVGFLFASRSSYFQYQSAGRTSGIEYLNNDPINIRTLITEDPEVTFNGTVNDTVANTHTLLIAAVAPTQPANNASALNAAANINFNQAVGATAPLYSVNLQTILSSSQSGSADVYLGSISMIDSVATYRSQFYRANMMQGQSSTQAAGTVTFSVWDPTATVSYLLPLQTTANSNCTTTCGQMNLQNTGGRQDAIVINGSNNFMSVRNSTGINNWGVRATQNNALGYIAPPRRSGTNFDFDYMRLIQREVKQARENMGNGRELKPVVSVGEAVIEGGTQDCKTRRDDKDIQNLECRLDEI